MPCVDSIALRVDDVRTTTIRTTSRSSSGEGKLSAWQSKPSGRSPRRCTTRPPYTLRAADPDPRRASCDTAAAPSARSYALHAATANAANPDADDASPDAVGTSFLDVTSARCSEP